MTRSTLPPFAFPSLARLTSFAAALALLTIACDSSDADLCDEASEADKRAPAAAPTLSDVAEANGDRAEREDAIAGADGGEAAKFKAKGELERDIFRRIVRAHINEVRDCYDEGLGRDPALSGRLLANFTIGADGRVLAPATITEGIGDPETETCVANAIQRWYFPKPQGGEVLVTYPFVLIAG